jgi:hypothetical protein
MGKAARVQDELHLGGLKTSPVVIAARGGEVKRNDGSGEIMSP